ncbi:macro domain-containing protein [Massilia sp. CCM 9210]|uniref:macro domain-containing protein n=1 Tax=Massilia scottii TaxID=3057166 RepID=UPI002796BB19|nr:macro domain-containing protein [Massilia sp. CCM 9210]MDQ1812125.1 macro domain-containing protein [Massilia sp. CCM 9210]
MKKLSGDLLQLAIDGQFDVIIHGCNCQCQMGKGIALSVKRQFPEAYDADCQTAKGDAAKLGTVSIAEVERHGRAFHVVNGYTQYHWRGTGVKADYEAIRGVMKTVKSTFPGKRIGYPKIGAGLAGGDWEVIRAIIDEELAGENHAYVEYSA